MNEIDPPLPFGYTDFCDDIRREVAAKMTFVGMYSGQIKVFGQPPVHLPKLALAVHFFEALGDGADPMKLNVIMAGNDGSEEFLASVDIPPRDHEETPESKEAGYRASLNFILEFAPLIIKQHGTIKVRMERGGATYKLGALRITELSAEEAGQLGIHIPSNQPNQDTAPSN